MKQAIDSSGAELVVLTRAEYERLIEDAGDAALADAALAEGGPAMSAEHARAVLEGRMRPLAAWRASLGLSQSALAERSGVRAATISEVESGKVDPRVSTLRALAKAMGLEAADLID